MQHLTSRLAAGVLIVCFGSPVAWGDEMNPGEPDQAVPVSQDEEGPLPLHERVLLSSQARLSQLRYRYDLFHESTKALDDPRLRQLIEAFDAQMGREDYKAALATSQTILRQFPTSWMAHYVNAIALLFNADPDQAFDALNHADQLQPNTVHVMVLRGVIALAHGDVDHARESARSVLAQYPNVPDGLMLQGFVSVAAGDLEQAVHALEQLRKADAQYCPAHPMLTRLYRTLGRRRQALATVEAIPNSCSSTLNTWLKADVLLDLGRVQDAVGVYQGVSEEERQTAEGRLVGLRVAFAMRAYDRAVAISKQFVHDAPEEALGYVALCDAYLANKEFGLANEMAQLIERKFPDGSLALTTWGWVHEQQERYPEALEAYQRALTREPGNPELSFHVASLRLKQGQYDEALAVLRNGLAVSPNDYGLQKLLGKIDREMGNYPESIRAYQGAIAVQPERMGAHVGLGTTYVDSGQFEQAETAYQQATQLDPSDVESHWGLGLAYLRTGDYDRAISEAMAARALDPENGMPYEIAAEAYFKTGRRAEATATCERLAAHSALNAEQSSQLGWCYRKIEDDQGAIRAFEQAVQQRPSFVHALVQLGSLYNKTGHPQQAMAIARQGLQIAPKERRLLKELVMAYLRLRDRAQAEAILQQIVAMSQGTSAVLAKDYLDLGRIFSEAARAVTVDEDQRAYLQHAKTCYEQSLTLNPDSSDTSVSLANLYTFFFRYPDFHDDQRALDLYQDALRRHPQDQYAYYGLAYLRYRQGQQDEALRHLTRALEFDPAYRGAYYLLAYVYKRMGNYQKALETCQHALTLRPDDAAIYVVMGLVYGELRNAPEAQQAFEHALHLDPKQAEAYGGLATLYNKLGDSAKAIEAGTRAIALNPRLANAHNELGQAYGTTGQLDKALDCFKRAIALDPSRGMYYNNMGYAYLQQRDYQAAIPYLEQATQHHAGGLAYHNLGAAYQAVGKHEQAKQAYQEGVAAYRAEGQTRKADALEGLLRQIP